MKRLLDAIIEACETFPSTPTHIIASLLFISIGRWCLENVLVQPLPQFLFVMRLVTLLTLYAGSYFAYTWFASLFFKHKDFERIRSVILASMFGGLIPPLLFFFFPHSSTGSYDYFNDFTWNFISPMQPLEESVGIWLTVATVALYFLYKKRTVLSFVAGAAAAYVLAQFSGWFVIIPWQYLNHAISVARPDLNYPMPFSMDLVWVFIGISAFTLLRRRALQATLKRFHYSLIRGVIIGIGALLAGSINTLTVVEAVIFVVAGMLIQAENDYYDKEADSASARESTLTAEDLILVRFFMVLLVLPFIFIQPVFSILLGGFFLLGFVYNHPAFRFKKHFATASLIQGLATFLSLLLGIFSVGDFEVHTPQILLAIVISVIFGIISNIKDYKDVEDDRKAGIQTMYVVLSEHGISAKKTQAIMAVVLGILYGAVVIFSFFFFRPGPATLFFGSALVLTSPLPLSLLNHPRRSASSIAMGIEATLFLVYVVVAIFPLVVSMRGF